jgi:hypothetical protein
MNPVGNGLQARERYWVRDDRVVNRNVPTLSVRRTDDLCRPALMGRLAVEPMNK